MYILTEENKSLDTILIPDRSDNLLYSVLDHSDKDYVDYMFHHVVYLEQYAKASAVLKIGEYTVEVPLHWSVLLGDKDSADLEILPIVKFNGRDFSSFVFNPVTGYMPNYLPIEIVNIYPEVRWSLPGIKTECMLTVPLCSGDNPPCAFFVDSKNRLPEVIDIGNLL